MLKTNNTTNEHIILRMNEIFNSQKHSYSLNPMPSASSRIEKIIKLKTMLVKNADAFAEAVKKDFSSKPAVEVLGEIVSICDSSKYITARIKKWMKPEKRRMTLAMQPGKAKIIYQPLGVVGNMVPFNAPVFTACIPLITAISAGNNCMLKMPEGTPSTSLLFEHLISETFPEEHVAVINGGPDIAAAFAALPFNHIIFTGSGKTGKKIMMAAAENLTPVTLELGGKSPVIIDRDFPVDLAAERICFGKSVNGGQVCIGPDYVLVPEEKEKDFQTAYANVFQTFYPFVNNNPDYTAINNDIHLKRIKNIIEDAKSKGASLKTLSDEKITDGTRKHPQVLISGVTEDMTATKEELFGPILMIIPYDNFNDAIEYIKKKERPLALYYFGFNKKHREKVLYETHSGGVTINDVLAHGGINDLPFGGVGGSGMGQYGGREGFLTFSKAKAVVTRPEFRYTITKILYPPYTSRWLEKLLRIVLRFKG